MNTETKRSQYAVAIASVVLLVMACGHSYAKTYDAQGELLASFSAAQAAKEERFLTQIQAGVTMTTRMIHAMQQNLVRQMRRLKIGLALAQISSHDEYTL